MEEKSEKASEQESAGMIMTRSTTANEKADKSASDAGELPPKGDITAMTDSKQSECAGQSQAATVECHTQEEESSTGEKRPLEIRYQHHNLRSRLKKIKKAPPTEEVTASEAPTKKEPVKQTRSPRGEKADVNPQKKVKRLKRWEAWSIEDTDDFFEGLCEYGRDFDAIQKHIEKGHKKRSKGSDLVSKHKDQVRHFYYRTVNKVFKFVEPRQDLSLKERELHALVNYAEVRRKLRDVTKRKQWRKLSELINTGVATMRISGRNMRLRTPVCKALIMMDDGGSIGAPRTEHIRPQKIPAKVTIDLRPCDNATWSAVQSMSYNPRIRMNVCLQKKIACLIRVLSSRMIPANIRNDSGSKSSHQSGRNIEADMLFKIPEKTKVKPYEEICGRYVFDGVKGLIKLQTEQIPEGYHKRERPESKEDGPRIVTVPDVKSMGLSIPSEDTLLPPMTSQEGFQSPVTFDSCGIFSCEKDFPQIVPGSPKESPGVQGEVEKTDLTPSLITSKNSESSPKTQIQAGERCDTPSLPVSLGSSPERGEPGAKKGALVKSQKTGTVVGSTVLMPAIAVSVGNDFMNLTSINDFNILQTEDDDDESSKETTEGSGSGEENSQPETQVFKTKDDLLREGLTVSNSEHITLAEVYLMLGKPEKLKFGYQIVGEKSERLKTSSMLSKLVMLAREESQRVAETERKFVSVGTNTPITPIKKDLCPPQQPQVITSHPSGDINIRYGPDIVAAARSILAHNGQLTLLNPTNTLTHVNPQSTVEVPRDRRKDFQFARPLAPATHMVNPRIGNPPQQGIDVTASLNNAYLLPKRRRTGWGRQSAFGGLQLFHQRRAIQPRPVIGRILGAVPTGVPVNITVSSPQPVNQNISNDILSQAAINANIPTMPPVQTVRIAQLVKKPGTNINNNNQEMIGLSPLSTGPGVVKVNNICTPDPQPDPEQPSSQQLETPTKSRQTTTANNHLAANLSSLWTLDSSPLTAPESSPDVVKTAPSTEPVSPPPRVSDVMPGFPLNLGTPVNLGTPIVTVSTLADPIMSSALSTPKTTPERVAKILMDGPMSTPKAGGLDQSLLNTPVIHNKMATPSALNFSPLPSLLDMSMDGNSQDGVLSGFRNRLEELTKQQNSDPVATDLGNEQSTTTTLSMNLAAALTTAKISVPKGGDQSPFKLGGGNQWLHEESSQHTQMSLGTLLDQLEMSNTSPTKKSTASTMHIAPPLMHTDFSRDSVMSMDSHLQAMLNENSLDYVAKFADLAAHIAATGTEDVTESIAGQMLQTEQTVARWQGVN